VGSSSDRPGRHRARPGSDRARPVADGALPTDPSERADAPGRADPTGPADPTDRADPTRPVDAPGPVDLVPPGSRRAGDTAPIPVSLREGEGGVRAGDVVPGRGLFRARLRDDEPVNGTPLNGTQLNGTPFNEAQLNGTSVGGTPVNGTSLNGTPLNGSAPSSRAPGADGTGVAPAGVDDTPPAGLVRPAAYRPDPDQSRPQRIAPHRGEHRPGDPARPGPAGFAPLPSRPATTPGGIGPIDRVREAVAPAYRTDPPPTPTTPTSPTTPTGATGVIGAGVIGSEAAGLDRAAHPGSLAPPDEEEPWPSGHRLVVRTAWLAGAAVLLFGMLSISGLLSPSASVAVDDSGQLLGGLLAAGCGLWSWRRARPPDRLWRLLLGLGAGGWSIGQAIWSYYQVFEHQELPSPSLADVGFFTLPVLALPALWVFPARAWLRPKSAIERIGQVANRPFSRAVIVLDSLVGVAPLFLLAWSTSLGAAMHSPRTDLPQFLVALGYPISDLMLVVFVVLLGRFRLPVNPGALALVGAGIVCISVSDSFYLYLVSSGAEEMPPLYNIGFVIGPVLLGLSALYPNPPAAAQSAQPRGSERGLVLLPYLPLAATGLLVVGQLITDAEIPRTETYVCLALVAVVVLRQLVTLLDNVRLVRQLRDSQDQLSRQAFNDSLTGLANRALFRDRLDHAVEVHRADGRPLGLIFCDLDDFKLVNDGLGHAAGDELLRAVAERLRECVHPSDTVARLGGDEFAVLLESGVERPEVVGARILAAVERPFMLGDVADAATRGGTAVTVGASIGVAVMEPLEPEVDPDGLMARVDAAMYAAKRRGKNQIVTFRGDVTDDNSPGLIGDLRVLLAAQRADPLMRAGGSIDVMYQPVVRFDTEQAVALEALVRWQHPRHGLLPAELLLNSAEDAGMLGALEEQVLDTACRDVSLMRRLPGFGRLAVHVNLSAQRAGDPRLVGTVQEMLHRHGLPGQALVLEITETGRVPDLDIAAQVLTQIRRLDVRLALDDYGTGYSGLSYLMQLPIDIVKLDRSLTVAEPGSRASAIRDASVAMILDLGLDLIAEGVETPEQAGELVELGCELAQGFLYAKPRFLADLDFAGRYVG
jgi:diguanylate cyclase